MVSLAKLAVIGRAILKKSLIFLFDEATSSLDSRTEKEIKHKLDAVLKSHTKLVITHRHSTVRDADETIVLSDGRIVESVNHCQLLGNPGHSVQMWVRQSSGFSGDLDNDNVLSHRVERVH